MGKAIGVCELHERSMAMLPIVVLKRPAHLAIYPLEAGGIRSSCSIHDHLHHTALLTQDHAHIFPKVRSPGLIGVFKGFLMHSP